MDSSEKQTKASCKQITKSKKLPVTQKPSKYEASYGQVRYLMKRLNTVLSNKLREGRPSKFCRICKAEIQQLAKTEHLKRRRMTRRRMRKQCPDITRRPSPVFARRPTSLPLKNAQSTKNKRRRVLRDKQSKTVTEKCAES